MIFYIVRVIDKTGGVRFACMGKDMATAKVEEYRDNNGVESKLELRGVEDNANRDEVWIVVDYDDIASVGMEKL